ncbi:MAG: PQQ-binding-like beta-propeller repeat protein [Gemmataceae bacterium]
MRTTVGLLLVLASPFAATADDWPRWRGPALNGVSAETKWLDRWPDGGPAVAWRAAVGTGFSAVAVSGGRLYTLGNADDADTVHCLDAVTGKPVWHHTYAAPRDPNMFDGGPTATPAVDGNRVYTLSRGGDLFCFDAATGKVVWSKNVVKETGQRVPTWGLSGSPVVHDDLLLLTLGDCGVALDKATGKVIWNSEVKDGGYSSPVPFRRGGEWYAVFSSEDEYVAANLRTGKPLWRIPWPTRYGVNAADPIMAGEQVFVSSGYNKGAALWNVGGGEPATAWQSKTLRNQINCSVLIGGFLYGIDGDTSSRAKLRCVELKTGAVRWDEESAGCGSLMAAGGKLIVLSDRGELMVAPATPDGFKPTARAKVLDGKCWTVPVLANGRIYCRNADGDLVCLDVRRD